MIRLVLSPKEHAPLEQTRRTRPQLAERCHYILLNAQGWSVPQIARRLDRNEHTIRPWLKAYRSAGLTGLHNTPQSGRPATTGQRVSAHIEHLLAHRPSHFGSIEEGWTVDSILKEAIPKMAPKFFDLNRAPMAGSQNNQQAKQPA